MNRAVTYLNEAANPSSPALFFFNRTGIAQTGLSDTILKSYTITRPSGLPAIPSQGYRLCPAIVRGFFVRYLAR